MSKRRREEEDDAAASSEDEEAVLAAAAATAADGAAGAGAGARTAAAASSGKGAEDDGGGGGGDDEGDTKGSDGGGTAGSGASGGGGGGKGGSSRYRYAVVCSSNVNRSMEAHVALFNHKLRVGSYGAGRFVRLPVPGGLEGRSFEFGTPYETMVEELMAKADGKAQEFYRRTKLLDILKRNKQIKRAPERWQDVDADTVAGYDVVVCYENRIYDLVMEGA